MLQQGITWIWYSCLFSPACGPRSFETQSNLPSVSGFEGLDCGWSGLLWSSDWWLVPGRTSTKVMLYQCIFGFETWMFWTWNMKLFWQVEPSVHRVYDLIQRHQKKGMKDLWWIFEFKIMEHDDLMNLKTSIFCFFCNSRLPCVVRDVTDDGIKVESWKKFSGRVVNFVKIFRCSLPDSTVPQWVEFLRRGCPKLVCFTPRDETSSLSLTKKDVRQKRWEFKRMKRQQLDWGSLFSWKLLLWRLGSLGSQNSLAGDAAPTAMGGLGVYTEGGGFGWTALLQGLVSVQIFRTRTVQDELIPKFTTTCSK